MEMTLEALVAAGISTENAKAVIAAHKAAISGNYVPKARFDEVSNSLKERDSQISTLKAFEGTASELQAKVTALEASNKAKDEELSKAVEAERKKSAMTLHLQGKVHDLDMVLGLLDQDKVRVKADGTLEGFEEQIQQLQANKSFLFLAETGAKAPEGFSVKGKTPPEGVGTSTPAGAASDAASLGKQLAEQRLAQQKQLDNGNQHYFKV